MERFDDGRERAAAEPVVDVVELVDAVRRALSRSPVSEYKSWEGGR